ncbi:ABC transporter permease [Haloarchaeobius iranensis]|uniref:Peptide/nickel transport system permease protein n=1 Tax=Haloarchaeobius iranensis TaxID=996166 RepID=A0A1G9SM65_9EURY|nr:ABC transporter permease [Haloarchaeobius iranensis]SDM36603.1 peptide/nickel transport system permease protein [Haloarchaeobius iranensis]
MSRWGYFARRLLLAIPVVLFGVTITFAILRLGPLDPVAAILGPNTPPSQYARVEEQLGLNRPLWEQYIEFMVGLLTFDLGNSYVIQENTKAMTLIVQHAPRTLWLGFWSVLIPLFIGIPLGFYAGLNPNTMGDYFASFGGIIWRAMPNFWLGVIFYSVLSQSVTYSEMLTFGVVQFQWDAWIVTNNIGTPPPLNFYNSNGTELLTVGGTTISLFSFDWEVFVRAVKMVLPPAIVLGSASMGNEMRLGRTAVLETINSKYVETARAKGLSRRKIVWKHVFRNALIPLVPIILNEAFLLIGGSVIMEQIFAINGIGYLFFQAAIQGDMPLVGSLMYIFILIVVFMNIFQDFLYTIIDPRVGYE